ncbi:BLUF domain-containing protein [Herbaspirillum robiniae]|uniref:BLUF domain-containing protein n=1 Tax=Herbaspirillum robiniae TaxID=2014887 RepID=A0A246WJW5_9BURK|nr:BLUF domain-containing protein [Herbaspirillum robiniae]NUU04518.1 BLUF domain-containing protein [Herbaspirillum robiniae]OWY26420.1 blue light sensor protein [Herbaspirillum robiniae]
MLVRLIYASRARVAISSEVIDSILASARKNNPGQGITGVLCYSDSIFVQVLEGGRDQVNRIYGNLQRDERHHDLVLLAYESIDERQYSSWTMGKIRLDKINRSLLLKYSVCGELNPYLVSNCATVALLNELASTAAFAQRD